MKPQFVPILFFVAFRYLFLGSFLFLILLLKASVKELVLVTFNVKKTFKYKCGLDCKNMYPSKTLSTIISYS